MNLSIFLHRLCLSTRTNITNKYNWRSYDNQLFESVSIGDVCDFVEDYVKLCNFYCRSKNILLEVLQLYDQIPNVPAT